MIDIIVQRLHHYSMYMYNFYVKYTTTISTLFLGIHQIAGYLSEEDVEDIPTTTTTAKSIDPLLIGNTRRDEKLSNSIPVLKQNSHESHGISVKDALLVKGSQKGSAEEEEDEEEGSAQKRDALDDDEDYGDESGSGKDEDGGTGEDMDNGEDGIVDRDRD